MFMAQRANERYVHATAERRLLRVVPETRLAGACELFAKQIKINSTISRSFQSIFEKCCPTVAGVWESELNTTAMPRSTAARVIH